MYSDTAEASFESDENPDLAGEPTWSKEDGHEPEPGRVVRYSKAPAHTEAMTLVSAEAATLPDVMDETRPDVLDDTLPDVMGEMPDGPEERGIDALLGREEDADAPVPGPSGEVTPIALADEPAKPSVMVISSAFRPAEGKSGGQPGSFGTKLGLARGNGGEPRRQRALDVVMDARMRFWRERVALMVVALVLFWIVGNWVIGLTVAVLVGIAHAVWRSRSIASIPPGTKLDRAQRLTQRRLARMERAGYRALHARPIPGSDEMIDHLVVGPSGVYAIDSEKWNRKLPIRTRNGKQLWLGPESKKGRLEHAKWEAEQASDLLTAKLGREVKVRPALAIYGPHIPWDIAVIRDVDVFNGERLRRYLKKRSKVREVPKLSRDEIAKIYQAAESVLPWANAPAEATVLGLFACSLALDAPCGANPPQVTGVTL